MPCRSITRPTIAFLRVRGAQGSRPLLFAIQTKKAIALLTGDYGNGKTVVSTVISQLSPEKFKVAFITSPDGRALDLSRLPINWAKPRVP